MEGRGEERRGGGKGVFLVAIIVKKASYPFRLKCLKEVGWHASLLFAFEQGVSQRQELNKLKPEILLGMVKLKCVPLKHVGQP